MRTVRRAASDAVTRSVAPRPRPNLPWRLTALNRVGDSAARDRRGRALVPPVPAPAPVIEGAPNVPGPAAGGAGPLTTPGPTVTFREVMVVSASASVTTSVTGEGAGSCVVVDRVQSRLVGGTVAEGDRRGGDPVVRVA